jgi:hypothetical protein
MDRSQFRQATARAKMHILQGSGPDDFWLSPLEQKAATLLRKTWQLTDALAARMSSFTPDARSRTTLYPL